MSWSIEEAEDYSADLEETIAVLHDELNELREIQALTVERAENAETLNQQQFEDKSRLRKRAEQAEATLEAVYEDLGEQYRRAEQAERDLRSAESDLSDWRECAEKAEEDADRLRKLYFEADEERYTLRQKLNGVEAMPDLQPTIDHYRERAEKAEAELATARADAELHHKWIRELERLLAAETNRAERANDYINQISSEADSAEKWAIEASVDAEMNGIRAASWWEAAKFYYRTGMDYATWLRKARADRDAAEEANKLLARDLRHSREDYDALSESYDILESEHDRWYETWSRVASELDELKAALRTLGGDRD